MKSSLGQRAVLMRLSMGLPGEHRQDPELTGEVKQSHSLGRAAGNWIKTLYPPEALAPIKKLDNEARAYHATVTLPFDAGIGILPAGLIAEHGDKMRQFKGERDHLVESHFLANYSQWVDWARGQHNGTFDPDLYPGAAELRGKFYFRTEPLPVPDIEHFTGTVASLLGTDLESVNLRVRDAELEAQRELLRRIMAPVDAMAKKLAESPKDGKASPVFRDSLVGNVREIAALAPKLNLAGDAQIDAWCKDIANALGKSDPDALRKDGKLRAAVAADAAAMLKRLSGYTI
jgi:hypothetical protein